MPLFFFFLRDILGRCDWVRLDGWEEEGRRDFDLGFSVSIRFIRCGVNGLEKLEM